MASPTIAATTIPTGREASTSAAWPTRLRAAIAGVALAAAVALGCDEKAPSPVAALAALPTVQVQTRDEVLIATVPTDLVITIQERSLLGTSADGSFRLYLEHRPGEKLPAVLGALKDELLALGWEAGEEQHFERAVSFEMARGPKLTRQHRATWILEADRAAAGGVVVVCEAIAGETQAARLGAPLRELCQALRIGTSKPVGPAPPTTPTAPTKPR